MRKSVAIFCFCFLLTAGAAEPAKAQTTGGYEGLISGGAAPAPAKRGAAPAPAQDIYSFAGSAPAAPVDSRSQAYLDAANAKSAEEAERIQKANEAHTAQTKESLEKAVRDMQSKQQQYQNATATLEKNADGSPATEWTPKQHEEYQRNIQSMNKMQEDLEEMARKELERANRGEDVTR